MSKRQLPPSQRPERQPEKDELEQVRELFLAFQFKIRAAKYHLAQQGCNNALVWIWTAKAMEDAHLQEAFHARFATESFDSSNPNAICIVAEDYDLSAVRFLLPDLPENAVNAFEQANKDDLRLCFVLGKSQVILTVAPGNERIVD